MMPNFRSDSVTLVPNEAVENLFNNLSRTSDKWDGAQLLTEIGFVLGEFGRAHGIDLDGLRQQLSVISRIARDVLLGHGGKTRPDNTTLTDGSETEC